LFYLPVLHVLKITFLFMMCDISVCIIPWIGLSLPYSLLYVSPLLMEISIGLNVPHSYLYRNTWTIITFFTFFIYPPPPIRALLLVWPIYSCPSLFRCLFIVQCDFCLSILPVNVLKFKLVFKRKKSQPVWKGGWHWPYILS
jgi:hypothetical protein